MEKNNRVHKILRIILKVHPITKTYDFRHWRYNEIANEIKWFDFWRPKTHEIAGLCDNLIDDGIVDSFKDGPTLIGISISDPKHLDKAQKAYDTELYKIPLKWWVWPARILSACVGIATIFGVVDNMKSPDLIQTIEKQQLELKSAQDRAIDDSLNLRTLRDSLTDLKKLLPDSLRDNLKADN